ncbi:unnamed protein product [Microthlaspi erraticum]|uniref:Uncharacterized protein n=1 Tax=Microthlaspi erraticum TaxID=1685480 RepID=A0A6D2HX41_9BRAS|nr:unnamed protein product [Microthlaspi erraticum]
MGLELSKLDRVEAWPVELRNSTGWSSRRSSWSSRWLLPSSFAYPVELRPCAKSLHAPSSHMLQNAPKDLFQRTKHAYYINDPTDYVYPFIATGVESNDPAIATQVNNEVFRNQPEEPDTPEPTWEDYLGHQNVSPTYWTRKLNEIAGYTSSMEHGEGSIPQDQGEANAIWCTMYGEQDAPNSVAGNEYQIPDLNQTTEEGTGENEWPQDDEAKGEGLPEDCEDESPSTVSSHATMRSMWKDGTS